MQTGTVSWYNESAGFGFIEGEAGGNRLYFQASERDSLTVGSQVAFDIETNPSNNRPMAVNVRPAE